MHWRETDLFEVIKMGGKLSTSDIINRSRMCKVTALKYLKSLEEAGYITYERIGPTKIWRITQHDVSLRGEAASPSQYENIFRMLKEYEDSTGKKAFVLMSAEDFDANPVGLQVSLLEDGTPKIELKSKKEEE